MAELGNGISYDETDFEESHIKAQLFDSLTNADDTLQKLKKAKLGWDTEELEREKEFNQKLHDRIINAITKDWEQIEETDFMQILPALRIQHIKEWKKIIVGDSLSDKFDELTAKKAECMASLVKQFDDILKEKQRRDQKNEIFDRLLRLFWGETATLFVLLVALGLGKIELDAMTVNLFVGATIIQLAGMITAVVWHLYPSDKWKIKAQE